MSERTWRFRQMERAELNSNPVEGEFFTPQGIADALVRESIQNSLDARRDDYTGPVKVRIAASGTDQALPADQAEEYLRGLRPHLAAQADLPAVPEAGTPMPFLVIEDFGTRGLCGDELQADDREQRGSKKNHFYYFWRNVGRSGKQDEDLGRWGLGKTVFPATSIINSFFGLTYRADDDRLLLMGQSVLTVHKIEGHRRYPYGYFADHDPKDGFSRPIGDDHFIRAFAAHFGLRRLAEPGLSIVVPFPDPELKEEDLIRSVIVQYFHPILAGRLEVEVEFAGNRTALDRDSIDRVTNELGAQGRFRPESLGGLYEMTRWSLQLRDEERLLLDPAGLNGAPKWSESLLPGTGLEELQRRFDRGERVALRAQVGVHRKGASPVTSHFDIYAQRDDTLDRAEEHYVRQGITIPGIRMVRDRTVRGLVVVEHPQLSSLLGDAENPSHTDWQERRSNIKKHYDQGAFTVRFVRSSLREIVRMLARAPEGRDENLLRDIFSLPLEGGEPDRRGGRTTKRRRRREPPPPPAPPLPRSQPFRLDRQEGGFQIVSNADVARAGDRIVVRMAYEVRRGNAFAAYDPLDFQLERMNIQRDGLGVESVQGNRLELRADRPDYRLTVSGFDVHRDLVVSARRAGGAE